MRSRTAAYYARLAVSLKTHSDLHHMMEEVTPKLGFDYYGVVHHVPDLLAANLVALSSFPPERDFAFYSPIRQMCRRSVAGFTWSQMKSLKHIKRQGEFLRASRRHNVGDGFTIPANIPDDVSGSVSYAMAGHKPLPVTILPVAQYIGCLAYEAALRISKIVRPRTGAPSALSARQLECVVLAARGKTDWEIGKILKISKDTAHKHIQNAMGRLGVTTRTQLVVRALFDSHLSFDDVLDSK